MGSGEGASFAESGCCTVQLAVSVFFAASSVTSSVARGEAPSAGCPSAQWTSLPAKTSILGVSPSPLLE